MDFGTDNTQTVQYVIDNLGTVYAGWSLPTLEQVLTLWNNAFGSKGSTFYETFDDANGSNYYANYITVTVLVIQYTIPCSASWRTTLMLEATHSLGFFKDNYGGGLSNVNIQDLATVDYVSAAGRTNTSASDAFFSTSTDPVYSTMFVKAVLEPARLALFGIGLAGMGFARKKKNLQKLELRVSGMLTIHKSSVCNSLLLLGRYGYCLPLIKPTKGERIAMKAEKIIAAFLLMSPATVWANVVPEPTTPMLLAAAVSVGLAVKYIRRKK